MSKLIGMKLKLKSGEVDITVDEGRRLYGVLEKIFGENKPCYIPYVPSYPLSPSVPMQPYYEWTWTS